MTKFRGTAGDDSFSGALANDTFDLSQGGNDTAYGWGGNDVFVMGGALNALDKINGGSGSNTVVLDGDYSSQLVFNATTMLDIQTLKLTAAFDYGLKTADATVAAGKSLLVDGSTLGASDKLAFNGSAEIDGTFSHRRRG
jgi:hypothetical protein